MSLRPRLLICFAAAGCLAWLTGLHADEAPPEKIDTAERLVRQLGSPDYAERQAASKALREMGEPALDALRLARGSTDPEVRRRAAHLAEAIEARLYRELRRLEGHRRPVECVTFSPDGRRALSAESDGNPFAPSTLLLWDLGTGKLARRLEGHHSLVLDLVFSPDGRRAASAAFRETILWDLGAGKEALRLLGRGSGLAFLPDGHRLVAGDRLVDARTGREVPTFGGLRWPSVAVSPDGRRVLMGNRPDGLSCGTGVTREALERYFRGMVVQLHDVETGRVLWRLEGHKGPVTRVAFSPDGRLAFSASLSDSTVRVWDVKAGKQLRSLEVPAAGCVAFSPDCRRVLAGGEGGAVVFWDLGSGKELRRYYGHKGRVSCVAFSPDGRLALSGGQDKTLRLWRLPK